MGSMQELMKRMMDIKPVLDKDPAPDGGSNDELASKVKAEEIIQLATTAKSLFIQHGMMAEVVPPACIFGDFHGQLADFHRLAKTAPPIDNPQQKYVFLGDYVDRGKQQTETILLLLAFKVVFPNQVTLIRGNHETANVNSGGGFKQEVERRYPASPHLWYTLNDAFAHMPITALIGGRILCMHGGLSPHFTSFNDLRNIPPMPAPAVGTLALDLMWADPKSGSPGRVGDPTTWEPNKERQVSYYFGELAVDDIFEREPNLQLICRAHQCPATNDGYEWFARKRVITIFSAPNYGGSNKNHGAFLKVDADFNLHIQKVEVRKRGDGEGGCCSCTVL